MRGAKGKGHQSQSVAIWVHEPSSPECITSKDQKKPWKKQKMGSRREALMPCRSRRTRPFCFARDVRHTKFVHLRLHHSSFVGDVRCSLCRSIQSRHAVTHLASCDCSVPPPFNVLRPQQQSHFMFFHVCFFFVLDTIRTSAMRVVHITVKTKGRRDCALSLYCTVLSVLFL